VTAPAVVTVELYAHAWPFDGRDGNPSMVEVAERFGVLMEDITGETFGPRPPFAWVYRLVGPVEHVDAAARAYWGDDWAGV
jgi:hypothetical protein